MRPPSAWWFASVPGRRSWRSSSRGRWSRCSRAGSRRTASTCLALGARPGGSCGFTAAAGACSSTALTLRASGCRRRTSLHRLAFRGRRALLSLLTVPFVLPTVVVGTAFRALLPGAWAGTLGGDRCSRTCSSTSPSSCAWSAGCGRTSTDRYEQAARTLGASPVARLAHGDLAAAAPGGARRRRAGLPLHVHVVRRGPRARRTRRTTDARGGDLPPYRAAVRPARARRRCALLQLVAVAARRWRSRAGCSAGSPYRQRLRPATSLHRPPVGRDRALVARRDAARALLVAGPLARAAARLAAGRRRLGAGLVAVALGTAGPTTRDVGAGSRCGSRWRTPSSRPCWRRGGRRRRPRARSPTPGAAATRSTPPSMLPLGTRAVTLGFGLLITFACRAARPARQLDHRADRPGARGDPARRAHGPAGAARRSTRGCARWRRRSARRRGGRGARSTCPCSAARSAWAPASPPRCRSGEFGATSFLARGRRAHAARADRPAARRARARPTSARRRRCRWCSSC